MTRSALLLAATGTIGLMACTGDVEIPNTSSSGDYESFEEFESATYKEPWEGGVYIVDGDQAVPDIKQLEELWALRHADSALLIHRNGSTDAKWSDTQKLNITYCVSSSSFGSRYNTAVTAMANAAGAWEQVANVNFVHVSAQDSNCTASNNNVVFDVRYVTGQPYVARAFFPGNSRSSRNVLIDQQAFGNMGVWTLTGVLRHELGHTLGFRHEHTRYTSNSCYEDASWRALTNYDSSSVMHYPHCNGTQTGDLVITQLDAQGAQSVYGAPGGDDPDDPPPPPPPPPGGETTETASGSLNQGQTHWFGPISVTPSTNFRAVMTGTGDPDIYVRFGAWPTSYSYNCRPYLDGPDEACDLTVPSNRNTAYIAINGYRAATYNLTVTYTKP
jgi:hypothetical protein